MSKEQEIRESLEQRVARLERERWILRGILLVIGMIIGGVLVSGASSGGKGIIGSFAQVDTGHLVLRDTDGQMRAWLGVAEGGPRLIFFDASGQQRMGVGMTRQSEPALAIYDPGENSRVVIGMMEGWPGIVLRDPQGRKRAALFSRDDWGSLYFYDRRETRRTGIGQFAEAGAINVCDENGKERIGLTTDRTGSSLSFFDVGGMRRMGVGMMRKDEPALGIFTHEGETQVSLASIENVPSLNIYGTNKTEVVFGQTTATNKAPRIEVYGPERKLVWQAP